VIGMEKDTATWLSDKTNTDTTNSSPLMQFSQNSIDQNELLSYGALGNTEAVTYLLSQKADPNTRDDNGMTILHYAAQYGYIDIVKTLLTPPSQINMDILDDEDSPLLLAIEHDQNKIIELILSVYDIKSGKPLCFAAEKGLLDPVKILLAHARANAADDQGNYPLCYASQAGHVNVMKYLIETGKANVNCCSQNNTSPLHRAATMGHTSAALVLIEHGAHINTQESRSGFTPLHCAATNGHAHTVKLLLLRGADVNAKNNSGKTALHYAVLKNHQPVIQELITQNIDIVDAEDNEGNSALDLAKTDEVKDLLISYK
jgi:ankyrin repeat protein